MTRIKVCGITNIEDALAATELGVDALGFIRVEESPRFVPDERLVDLALSVPPMVTRVGVLRDFSGYTHTAQCCFDALQVYTDVRPANPRVRFIRAYRVSDEGSLEEIMRTLPTLGAILLDAYCPDRLGGSGETFNWDLAVTAKERFGLPIILAGGLTPDNVGEAIRRVRPYAVDVSSGVETSPGKKDHAKMKAFVEAVRAADR